MSLNYRETQIVKGMLARGDKQHDIASYFGVNGGRIAEVASGNCDYPNASPIPDEKLPPPGPYVGAKTVFEIKSIIEAGICELSEISDEPESSLAIEILQRVGKQL